MHHRNPGPDPTQRHRLVFLHLEERRRIRRGRRTVHGTTGRTEQREAAPQYLSRIYGTDGSAGLLCRSTPRQADDSTTRPSRSGPTRLQPQSQVQPDAPLFWSPLRASPGVQPGLTIRTCGEGASPRGAGGASSAELSLDPVLSQQQRGHEGRPAGPESQPHEMGECGATFVRDARAFQPLCNLIWGISHGSLLRKLSLKSGDRGRVRRNLALTGVFLALSVSSGRLTPSSSSSITGASVSLFSAADHCGGCACCG